MQITLARATRDCRARVTVTCEEVTSDPDAVCGACAAEVAEAVAALADAPF